MKNNEEQVLVIPRAAFDKLGSFQGIQGINQAFLPKLLAPEHLRFLPRPQAENDPSFKQLIPYAVVTHENRILRYFRGSSSGEQRLVAKASVGVGGHINQEDHDNPADGLDFYRTAVERELREELHLVGTFSDKIVGLLNDDSNEVGQVHLGIVHHLQLDDAGVQAAESALTGLKFLTVEEIRADRALLETWSQIVIESWEDLSTGGT